jgi:hypothetical protein
MVNHQIIVQASGVLNYILKYVAKVDKGNKAILFVDGYTNNIRFGSQFLHNTKITTSAINESKPSKVRDTVLTPWALEFLMYMVYILFLVTQKSPPIWPLSRTILAHLSFVLSTQWGLINGAMSFTILQRVTLLVSLSLIIQS